MHTQNTYKSFTNTLGSMEEPVESNTSNHNLNSHQPPSNSSSVRAGVVIGTGHLSSTSAAPSAATAPRTNNSNVLFDEAVDLEPIDFEHFVDEPDMYRNQSERMFQVTLGTSPPMRGR